MASKSSWLDHIPSLSDDPTHPGQVALRTYALALALSLGPSLIPFVTALVAGKTSSGTSISALRRVLRRELGHDGFAFAITLSVGGGAALHHLWNHLDTHGTAHSKPLELPVPTSISRGKRREIDRESGCSGPGVKSMLSQAWLSIIGTLKDRLEELTPEQRTFIANVIASSAGIMLLQEGRERASKRKRGKSKSTSPTLDLTLLLVVRALDSVVQSFIHSRSGGSKEHKTQQSHSAAEPKLVKALLEKERRKQRQAFGQNLTMKVDALLFWACSARIMWCFFYEPQRLPRSYVKWINTLANLDPRLLKTLNLLREGKWFYGNCTTEHVNFLKPYASDLGHPTSWADPTILPSRGGASANDVWKTLGVTSRPGVGGLPCELVHANVGRSLGLSHSCVANSGLRGLGAFVEAIAIYIPAHFVPVLMTRPQTLLRPHRFLQTLSGALRSATFLSTFVASYYFAVCFTRSLVFAKYLPFVSHNFWDGPFGCMLAGSLVCGSSIWIENGKRRGEMALYVMPKALRACLPYSWLLASKRTRIAERAASLVIILSISTLLTAAVHRPESLRGLSRWTLSFIMNGPNAGFWKRKRRDPSIPPTPSVPSTSANPSVDHTPPVGLSRSHTPAFANHSRNRTSEI
ncbi:hypothetical protein NP233_g962 [Leucocoprinus birnbaumii]|uniref:Transmembrane protein 135 N-terminal domain-containing protein n=1 Tax=Leucocoprinus birnbaumii TaxID=56174 RepID=A0AAD5W3P7_9AGAR|nr:hypothetical protein NP233_g962 [Leucocoprinus birnbaumii]